MQNELRLYHIVKYFFAASYFLTDADINLSQRKPLNFIQNFLFLASALPLRIRWKKSVLNTI